MKIKTTALTGRALDWAVALAIGAATRIVPSGRTWMELNAWYVSNRGNYNFKPTTDWRRCGELIEEYKIQLQHSEHIWFASCKRLFSLGRTPQIAICRAVVAAQLGDEVEIPDELVEENNHDQ
ncbi:phage protein NinX family protein [Xenorhabdus griffiniae]|uniref:phage protein NinX family protein n=1 Tax=Xenorhabdus griffiniae TaxID=351672 RepID=UPI0030CB5B28